MSKQAEETRKSLAAQQSKQEQMPQSHLKAISDLTLGGESLSLSFIERWFKDNASLQIDANLAFAWLCPFIARGHGYRLTEVTTLCEQLIAKGFLPSDELLLNVLEAGLCGEWGDELEAHKIKITYHFYSPDALIKLFEVLIRKKNILSKESCEKISGFLSKLNRETVKSGDNSELCSSYDNTGRLEIYVFRHKLEKILLKHLHPETPLSCKKTEEQIDEALNIDIAELLKLDIFDLEGLTSEKLEIYSQKAPDFKAVLNHTVSCELPGEKEIHCSLFQLVCIKLIYSWPYSGDQAYVKRMSEAARLILIAIKELTPKEQLDLLTGKILEKGKTILEILEEQIRECEYIVTRHEQYPAGLIMLKKTLKLFTDAINLAKIKDNVSCSVEIAWENFFSSVDDPSQAMNMIFRESLLYYLAIPNDHNKNRVESDNASKVDKTPLALTDVAACTAATPSVEVLAAAATVKAASDINSDTNTATIISPKESLESSDFFNSNIGEILGFLEQEIQRILTGTNASVSKSTAESKYSAGMTSATTASSAGQPAVGVYFAHGITDVASGSSGSSHSVTKNTAAVVPLKTHTNP